ncbi:MAG TPA: YdeI/OmpD-associated family protein [Gemmatimonadaceae bacterium]
MVPPTERNPLFFSTPDEFRRWLAANHARADELWVGFYRRDSGRPSITWPESVDEALCVGWIDGIRKSHDAESYKIRFTPRRARSIWSRVNLEKIRVLTEQGRMEPSGIAAYEAHDPARTQKYSFERGTVVFDAESEKAFRRNRRAWAYFSAQPPYYRRVATHFVMSAAKPETRARRLATLIAHSAKQERLPQTQSASKSPRTQK